MVNVYYAFLDDARKKEIELDILPKEWREYVSSIKDEKRRVQSFYVRKLLLYAFADCGVAAERFFSDESGRWFCDAENVDFSMSHSHAAVAVAVRFNGKVGVDVERVSDRIVKLEKKLAIIGEHSPERLTQLWAQKESAFKFGGENPRFIKTTIKDKNGDNYVLCAAISDGASGEAAFIKVKDL